LIIVDTTARQGAAGTGRRISIPEHASISQDVSDEEDDEEVELDSPSEHSERTSAPPAIGQNLYEQRLMELVRNQQQLWRRDPMHSHNPATSWLE